jgi:hypothetical protein
MKKFLSIIFSVSLLFANIARSQDSETTVLPEVVITQPTLVETPKPTPVHYDKFHVSNYILEELYIDEDQTWVNHLRFGWSVDRDRAFIHNVVVQGHSRTGIGYGRYGKNWDFEIDTLGTGYLYGYFGNGLEGIISRNFLESEAAFDQRIYEDTIALMQTVEFDDGQFVAIAEHTFIEDGNYRERIRLNYYKFWDDTWSLEAKYTGTWYHETLSEYYSPNVDHVAQGVLFFHPSESRYKYGIGPSWRINQENLGILLVVKHRSKKDSIKAVIELNSTNYFYLYAHIKF